MVEGIPQAVLGGAGIALFGMVAASGVRTLSKVRFNNANILVVAISLAVGLLPTVAVTSGKGMALAVFGQLPEGVQIVVNSGISAGAITAIILNLVFNHFGAFPKRKDGVVGTAIGAGAVVSHSDERVR